MDSGNKLSGKKFTVVPQEAVNQIPYPYVFVEDDGSVRELLLAEKSYLETPFLPMDGARPAIKESYDSKNGWGSVRGFCQRLKIPAEILTQINKDPAPSLKSDELNQVDETGNI